MVILMPAVIRVQNLSKCYQIYDRPQDRLKQSLWRGRKQFFREFWALKDVSFEIAKGESVGIIGRNGSGKSTLLQLIAGTLNPTSGSVEVNGRLAALLELGSGFNPEFTGRENVYLNGIILGLGKEEIDNRFDSIAAFADIGDFLDQPIKTYSSGMLMRLAFSVSVNVEPDVLIVDEALAVGDAGFQFKCMERLDRLTKSGTTLLFVSHDVSAVKAFCSRAFYLERGKIKASGVPADIVERFLLDMRDEQTRARTTGAAVALKPSLAGAGQKAFGTEQGRIVSAEFLTTGGTKAVLEHGQTIQFRVVAEYDSSVSHPAIGAMVMDRRNVPIGGTYFSGDLPSAIGEFPARVELIFSFPVKMTEGSYFVTLFIEDKPTKSYSFLVDKQVALLSFDVISGENSNLLGMIDLDIDVAMSKQPESSN